MKVLKKINRALEAKRKEIDQLENQFVQRYYGISRSQPTQLAQIREQQKKFEKLLGKEKKFSEGLISSSVDGICAFDTKYRYTVWNFGMEYITGISKKDALGHNAFKTFPFLKKIGEDKFFAKALEGRTSISRDQEYNIPATGHRGFFEARYSPLFDEKGKVIGGLSIVRDVTQHKQIDEALKKSHIGLERAVEERTAELSKANLQLEKEIVERREAEKRIKFDNTLLKLLSYSNHRKKYLQAVLDFLRELTHCQMLEINTTGQKNPDNLVFLPIKFDNRTIATIETTSGCRAKIDPKTTDLIKTLLPLIGEGLHKFNIQNQLKESHELLERFFSNLHVLAAYMDIKFNFIRVNPAYAKSDGHEPNYYIGKNHFDLFPDAENEKIFRNVLKSGETFTVFAKPFEYKYHPEKGVTFWDWTLSPVKDDNGQVLGLLLCLVDVTERIRAQEKLFESYQHLGIINRQVAILLELNKNCAEAKAPQVIRLILDSAISLGQAKIAALYVYDFKKKNFRLITAVGLAPDLKKRFNYLGPRQFSRLTQLIAEKKKIYGLLGPKYQKNPLLAGLKSYLAIPFMAQKTIQGMFLLGFDNRESFSNQELDFYDAFAAQSSFTFQNLNIFKLK